MNVELSVEFNRKPELGEQVLSLQILVLVAPVIETAKPKRPVDVATNAAVELGLPTEHVELEFVETPENEILSAGLPPRFNPLSAEMATMAKSKARQDNPKLSLFISRDFLLAPTFHRFS